MKPKKSPAVWNNIMLLWSLACLVVFAYFPGAISQIHGISLRDAQTLAGSISRIDVLAFIFDTVKSFLGTAFYGIACLSFGTRLAVLFKWNKGEPDCNPTAGAFLPVCFLAGNAVFSILFLSAASLFSLTRTHSIVIMSLGFISGLGQFNQFAFSAVRRITPREKAIVIFSAAILLAALWQASARISYDASSIYFSNAKLSALENHSRYFLDGTFIASISQATITYSALIQVFGEQSARMSSWLAGAATIYLGVELARLAGASRLARYVFPALVLTSTAFVDLLGDGKVDLFGSAYALASIYWFVRAGGATQNLNRTAYILSGCLAGFACILRPNHVFLLGLYFLTYALQQWQAREYSLRQLARHVGWMLLGTLGLALFHLAINKILLGSPIAFWSVITKINPAEGPWDYDPDAIWAQRMLYPLVVTFKNSGASLGNISPLIVSFLPFLALSAIRKRCLPSRISARILSTTVVTLASWVFLFFTVVEVRYVLFLWIILFIPIAEILAGILESPSAILRWTSFTYTAFLMSFILIRSVYISVSTYSPVDSAGNPRCFDSVLCNQVESVNAVAGPGERVLVLSPFRYYLRTDLFTCSTRPNEYEFLREIIVTSPEEFWIEVYRSGYRYILYDSEYAIRYLGFKTIPSPVGASDWLQLETLFNSPDGLHIAYELEVANAPTQVRIRCEQSPPNNWTLQTPRAPNP